jgi:hypothetical protein
MTFPPTPLSRRGWLSLVARGAAAASALAIVGRDAGAALASGATLGASVAPPTPIMVHKDASCRCCEHWVTHLRANGFKPTVRDEASMETVKQTLGVPTALQSCHTAVVGGYVIEGHVPAADIHRLLSEHPKIAGLAVPDMPSGTPGMAPPGAKIAEFDVVSFQLDGTERTFARY